MRFSSFAKLAALAMLTTSVCTPQFAGANPAKLSSAERKFREEIGLASYQSVAYADVNGARIDFSQFQAMLHKAAGYTVEKRDSAQASAVLKLESMKVAAPMPRPSSASSMLTYEVTVRGELGMATQSFALPAGTPPRIVDVGGASLEIAPARSVTEPTAISFYLNKSAAPMLTHTARVVAAAEKPVQVFYLVCGSAVTYYSPRPAKLPRCNSSTVAARQP
jgi:hypothetical protein